MTGNEARQYAVMIYRNFLRRGAMNLTAAMSAGMVPKDLLKDGVSYIGHCRNAEVAKWSAALQKFVYMRTKFGSTFEEEIEHPEDDRGFDVFVPFLEESLAETPPQKAINEQLLQPISLQEPLGVARVSDQVGGAVSAAAGSLPPEAQAV